MKKALFLMLALTFLLVGKVYAQARGASFATITHTRTNFANVGVTGLDVNGNPGYITLTSSSGDSGYTTDWYIYADTLGRLCMASWQTIQAYTSFPSGSWDLRAMPCSRVGQQ